MTCATCERVLDESGTVHCTICGAHFHPGCAPRIATDRTLDQLVSLYGSAVHHSLLRSQPKGLQATVLATSAVVVALWGHRHGSARSATWFIKEASRLDDSFESLRAELELLAIDQTIDQTKERGVDAAS